MYKLYFLHQRITTTIFKTFGVKEKILTSAHQEFFSKLHIKSPHKHKDDSKTKTSHDIAMQPICSISSAKCHKGINRQTGLHRVSSSASESAEGKET